VYFSTNKRIDLTETVIVFEPSEDDEDVNIHLNGLYLAFSPEEWDKLVIEVAKARGLDVSEQPFSGDTIVTIPKEEL
jgi:hypothetical protein